MIKKSRLGCGAVALAISVASSLSCAAEMKVGSVLTSPATHVAAPAKAVLIGSARAGDRVVAVGERGVIVFSDDNGQSWQQASVPVSVSLVAVQFVDARRGWAVGHFGVVLSTVDGGENWSLQLTGAEAAEIELTAAQGAKASASDADLAELRMANAERLVADGPDKPFLALHFVDANRGVVAGAYGILFATQDGGTTWRSLIGQAENPSAVHIYAIAQKDQHWFLVGEQGYLARSTDDGQTFMQLESPYSGSFFTAIVRADGELLVAGLKGRAYTSIDDGESFQELKGAAASSFGSSIQMANGAVLLANQAGGLFVSSMGKDDTLTTLGKPLGLPVSSIVETADGGLVASGFAGISHVTNPASGIQE